MGFLSKLGREVRRIGRDIDPTNLLAGPTAFIVDEARDQWDKLDPTPELSAEAQAAEDEYAEIRQIEADRALQRYNRYVTRDRPVTMEAMSRLSGFKYQIDGNGNGAMVADSRYRNADGSVKVDTRNISDQAAGTDASNYTAGSSMGLEAQIAGGQDNVQENAALGTMSAVGQQTDKMQGLNDAAGFYQGQAVQDFGRNQAVATQATQYAMAQRQARANEKAGNRELIMGLVGSGLGAFMPTSMPAGTGLNGGTSAGGTSAGGTSAGATSSMFAGMKF